MEDFLKIFENISSFDLVYIFFTLLSLIKCYRKGFVLSILAASKWLFAYVLTLFLFPKVKPYVKEIIDNDYVLDVSLGIIIFIVVIFVILLINKGIKRAVTYSGIGTIDKIFGFFFGFIRAYVIVVCIFTTIDIIYNYKKWPIGLDQSIIFPLVTSFILDPVSHS